MRKVLGRLGLQFDFFFTDVFFFFIFVYRTNRLDLVGVMDISKVAKSSN